MHDQCMCTEFQKHGIMQYIATFAMQVSLLPTIINAQLATLYTITKFKGNIIIIIKSYIMQLRSCNNNNRPLLEIT